MYNNRIAGVLLHPTSLPGKYGIGDLGGDAYGFIDLLSRMGQTIWQVCPLGPTGYGDSPYQCFSAFAGNPNLISPDKLKANGWLTDEDLKDIPAHNPKCIDFGAVIEYKKTLLKKAYERFSADENKELKKDFIKFCKKESQWLTEYSLFMACKDYHGGVQWTQWDREIALRKKSAVEVWTEKLANEIGYYRFIQYCFFTQWKSLKNYAKSKNIFIVGDLPLYVAYDSADTWANKELFSVDDRGKLLSVAGVPPDYFSPTGQLWGNPLYNWDVMEDDDFAWWRRRIEGLLELVDIVRIDHFRGLEAYWKVPGNAETAEGGKWVKAPGKKLFNSIKNHLGSVPILAEDLGVITPEVEALRDNFGLPGMKILQFAFGTGMEKKFQPHNYINNCVVYTGSHDNDTTRGFFGKAKNEPNDIYSSVQHYMGYFGDNITFELIRLAYSSVAKYVIVPMQDVLNLDSDARMNFPGRLGGNWNWRFTWDEINDELVNSYQYLTNLYQREPKADFLGQKKK